VGHLQLHQKETIILPLVSVHVLPLAIRILYSAVEAIPPIVDASSRHKSKKEILVLTRFPPGWCRSIVVLVMVAILIIQIEDIFIIIGGNTRSGARFMELTICLFEFCDIRTRLFCLPVTFVNVLILIRWQCLGN
jgi:hypothetical protein